MPFTITFQGAFYILADAVTTDAHDARGQTMFRAHCEVPAAVFEVGQSDREERQDGRERDRRVCCNSVVTGREVW